MEAGRGAGKAVLLVVDAQVGVMRSLWDSPRIIENLSCAVDRARASGIRVIWVLHSADHLPKGSPEWQLVPRLAPVEGETVIDKLYNSAFEETELEKELARFGACHIFLGGAATNWCIRATAYGALDRGYDLTLIADAHTTANMETESGATIQAESIVDELNIVMSWLSYPDRKCAATTAVDVDFAEPSDEQ